MAPADDLQAEGLDEGRASMKVDLPTPGAPEMPMRIDVPAWGSSWSSRAAAAAR
jgi:hypothetical protein